MAVERAQVIHQALVDTLRDASNREHGLEATRPQGYDELVDLPSGLTQLEFLDILESQYQARHLDLEARRLRRRGTGFYTIGSAGHEGNAAVAAALRPTDPAFLHYRSGGFFAQRSKQVPGQTPIFDVLLSLCASSDDPIAGGRHKVFGSEPLWIPPQTSTIASHLPKAMGAAFALDRAKHIGHKVPIPEDSIIVCSFGDASTSHASALAGLNSSAWTSYQNLPMPILFVCEDNGIGISVQTPPQWIENVWSTYPGIAYFKANGCHIIDTYRNAQAAVEYCRKRRAPAFLHLSLVRLLGHAGGDIELTYHSNTEIQSAETHDPLRINSLLAIELGIASAEELLRSYVDIGDRIEAAAREAEQRPRLATAAEVARPIAERHPYSVRREAVRLNYHAQRVAFFGSERRLPELQGPQSLARLINWALLDLLAKHPQMLVFGQDVARRGGVYGITSKLAERAGPARIFNTLLDEQSILGLAIGAAHMGFLPVPEIQYLAYYQNAQDQIRSEAATLSFFSQGKFLNPLVARIPSWAYQKGFGGHFHNDNSIASIRDLPGVVIASPSRGDDAVKMLRTALALAAMEGRVVLFLEPIALYQTRDLYKKGDDGWRCRFPLPGEATELGKARIYECADPDITIVSWANGLWRSLQASRQLADQNKISAEVIDLRWLSPMDIEAVLKHGCRTGRILIVDEGRATGGVSEGIVTAIIETPEYRSCRPEIERYCATDSFIPLGPSALHVLPSVDGIVDRSIGLVGRNNSLSSPPPRTRHPSTTVAS